MKAADSSIGSISVIVPCYNERDHIETVVRSVLQGPDTHLVTEMFIVDGRSDDGTRDILDKLTYEFTALRVIDNPSRDVPHAMNLGLTASRGDVIIRMDAHSYYPSDYIRRLAQLLERVPEAGNVGGVWIVRPGADTLEARVVAAVSSSRFGAGPASYYRVGHLEPVDTDTVPFGCFRREVFDKVGGYDEQLVRNQDDELNARICEAGYRIILDPSIRIEYFSRPTIAKIGRMFFQYGYFKPLVCIKRRSLTNLRQLAPPSLVLGLTTLALPSLWFANARVMLLALLASYFAFAVYVGLAISRSVLGGGARTWAMASWCLVVVHSSYGAGYLCGTWDFVVWGRHRWDQLRAAVTR